MSASAWRPGWVRVISSAPGHQRNRVGRRAGSGDGGEQPRPVARRRRHQPTGALGRRAQRIDHVRQRWRRRRRRGRFGRAGAGAFRSTRRCSLPAARAISVDSARACAARWVATTVSAAAICGGLPTAAAAAAASALSRRAWSTAPAALRRPGAWARARRRRITTTPSAARAAPPASTPRLLMTGTALGTATSCHRAAKAGREEDLDARSRPSYCDSWRIVDSWFSRRRYDEGSVLRRDTGSRRKPSGGDIRQMTGQLKMRSSP